MPTVVPSVPVPEVKVYERVPLKGIAHKYGGGDCTMGTDKGTVHSYIDFYDGLLTPYIGKGIDFLEIGVATGKSLVMWHEFLQNARVFGMDIRPSPEFLKDHPEIKVWQADSTQKKKVDSALGGMTFDVIIDDGSHIKRDQIETARLFLSRVRPGGLYVIEDLQNDDVSAFREFGEFELVDLRAIKGLYDDLLLVFRSPKTEEKI